MNIFKGVYHDGIVEMIENPGNKKASNVLVIFPEKEKKIKKIFGLFKHLSIDYDQIEQELKELSKESEKKILTDESSIIDHE